MSEKFRKEAREVSLLREVTTNYFIKRYGKERGSELIKSYDFANFIKLASVKFEGNPTKALISKLTSNISSQRELVDDNLEYFRNTLTESNVVIVVGLYRGVMYVIDGQHRATILGERGHSHVDASIIKFDREIDMYVYFVYYNAIINKFMDMDGEMTKACQVRRNEKVVIETVVERYVADTRTTRFNSLGSHKTILCKEYLALKGIIFKAKNNPTGVVTYKVIGDVPSYLSHIFRIMDGVVFVNEVEYEKWVEENIDEIKKHIDESNKRQKDEKTAKHIEELEAKSRKIAKENAERSVMEKMINEEYCKVTDLAINDKMGGNWRGFAENKRDREINENWKTLYRAYDDQLGIDSGKEYNAYKETVKKHPQISKKIWVYTVRHDGRVLFDIACRLSYANKLNKIKPVAIRISEEDNMLLKKFEKLS